MIIWYIKYHIINRSLTSYLIYNLLYVGCIQPKDLYSFGWARIFQSSWFQKCSGPRVNGFSRNMALINLGKPPSYPWFHWFSFMFPKRKPMENMEIGSSEASVAPSPQRKVEASDRWSWIHRNHATAATAQAAADTVRQCGVAFEEWFLWKVASGNDCYIAIYWKWW